MVGPRVDEVRAHVVEILAHDAQLAPLDVAERCTAGVDVLHPRAVTHQAFEIVAVGLEGVDLGEVPGELARVYPAVAAGLYHDEAPPDMGNHLASKSLTHRSTEGPQRS